MRFGIPVLGIRIAPRCTIAEALLVVTMNAGGIVEKRVVALEATSWLEVLAVLTRHRIDTLVCGGIRRDERAFLQARNISVVENVACTTDSIVAAIAEGRLRPGLGFGGGKVERELDARSPLPGADSAGTNQGKANRGEMRVDCLACADRLCLRGEPCHLGAGETGREDGEMLEAAQDIACEEERTLCRLSELIYFCLEMKYRRIGVAYCMDLAEPARMLVMVLRRFFDVSSVCCRIGGATLREPTGAAPGTRPSRGHDRTACNPVGQAKALEQAGSELNVMVGLCMGADCVFARASTIPATTLFVKDKSLANNPIGALYSDYYLKEAVLPPLAGTER